MTVLILGAGTMQLPALGAARELGFRVCAADGNPGAPGAAICDRFFPVDLKDREGLLAAAMELRSEGGLEAVFTAGTDFSANVAWLAERLGLPGHSFQAAQAASDKLLMRERFAAAGIPSPRFVEVRKAPDPGRPVPGGLSLPLVVKPADNMGARGCRLARSGEELSAAVAAALPFSRSGRAIVEEYVEGPEFSIDALVHDGKIEVRGFADRHISFEPYFVELGHSLPSVAEEGIRLRVLEVFEAGVRCLGLSHGAAKGDMKWSPSRGGPVIGEIAARLSGGYMSGWTYPYASGIDLTKEALCLAAGLRPEGGGRDRGWASAERAFISIPGRVASIHGLRDAGYSPFIKETFQRAAPGDRVAFPSNNVEKCGNLISQAPSVAEASRAADAALRGVLIRLAPGEPETEAFLEGRWRRDLADGSPWPPRAFEPGADILAAIEGLEAESPTPLSPGPALTVADLPGKGRVEGRDWAGRGFSESADLALRLGGARFLAPGEAGPPRLSRRFWRALVRGGAQAALYVIDSARKEVP